MRNAKILSNSYQSSHLSDLPMDGNFDFHIKYPAHRNATWCNLIKHLLTALPVVCIALQGCTTNQESPHVRTKVHNQLFRCGYINKEGVPIIDMKYLKAEPFQNGLGKVAISFADRQKRNEKYIYIYVNQSGSQIHTSPSTDAVLCLGVDSLSATESSLIDGLQPVPISTQMGIRWGYKNENGELVIKPTFTTCSNFSNGLAIASIKMGSAEHNSLPPAKLKVPSELSADGNFGFIDKQGKFVISPKYENVAQFSEGLAAVQVKGKWGYINKNGQLQIPPKYETAARFSEGMAAVQAQGKWGYINKNGQLQILPKYEFACAFHEGLAAVIPNIISDTPKESKLLPRVEFINKSNSMIIKPDFYMPFRGSYFVDGLAPVVALVQNHSFGDEYKFGYIDRNGKLLIPPNFYEAGEFSEGLASACICTSTSEAVKHAIYASARERIWNQRSPDY